MTDTIDGRTSALEHVVEDREAITKISNRLRRAEGQLRGVIGMLDEGRGCHEIVIQLAAVSKAVDRAAIQLIATSLRECVVEGDQDPETVSEQLQKMLLALT